MSEPVRVYPSAGSTDLGKDTILPPGSTVHSLGPAISYAYIDPDSGSLWVAVREPFVIARVPGSSWHAFYLRHPDGGKT